jgi:hypothetical protein
MLADGTATFTVRYMHMTNKGEAIIGTQETPNQKGVVNVKGEGTAWTVAPRLHT